MTCIFKLCAKILFSVILVWWGMFSRNLWKHYHYIVAYFLKKFRIFLISMILLTFAILFLYKINKAMIFLETNWLKVTDRYQQILLSSIFKVCGDQCSHYADESFLLLNKMEWAHVPQIKSWNYHQGKQN